MPSQLSPQQMAAVNPIVSDVVLSLQRTALNNLIGGNEERCVSVVVCHQYNSPFSVPGQLKQVSCTHALCWTRYKAAVWSSVWLCSPWQLLKIQVHILYYLSTWKSQQWAWSLLSVLTWTICVAQYILPIFLGLALISLALACAIGCYRLLEWNISTATRCLGNVMKDLTIDGSVTAK